MNGTRIMTRFLRPRVATGLLCVFMLAWAHLAGAVLYTVTDLGVFNESASTTYNSQPNNINSSNQIAAGNWINGANQAMLYGGGVWTNLGTLGGANAQAEGLNNLGWVVGRSGDGSSDDHAFLWIAGATNGVAGNPQMVDLGVAGYDSDAGDINNNGVIAGWAYNPNTQNNEPFSYTNGVMTDLQGALNKAAQNSSGNVSLEGDSYSHAINDTGHIVGFAQDNNSYTGYQAFFWTNSPAKTNGTALFLGDVAGGYNGSEALGININDQITGDAETTSTDTHAFRYVVSSNAMIDLGVLGNGDYSSGNCINNSNIIVGLSNLGQAGVVYHAFIAVSNTLTDLNTLLDSSGTNWTLTEADYINDAGKIVGTGTVTNDGLQHAFLLTPVVPAVFTPKITAFKTSKTNVVLTFTTTNAATYYLDSRTNLVAGGWSSNLVGSLAGTGSPLTVTNPAATTSGNRFFRIRQTIP
jgi:probable HAF family extracellular repeat protein